MSLSKDVSTLIEMGFPQNRAEKALAKTGYKGAQVAMDWLFDHQEDADIDELFEAPQGHILGKEASDGATSELAAAEKMETKEYPPQEACSLKCDECGKMLKSERDVQAHAARSGHASFSESTEEIKPLTEDEKREQLAKIQEKMKQKRFEKEEQEKKDHIQREKLRRAAGKDMSVAKQKLEEMEMRKIAEAKKREKEEARLARQKVKEDIERDKRERAAKQAKKCDEASVAAVSVQNEANSGEQKKEYDKCRLQIRLTNGQSITQTFGAKEELAAVRLYIEINRTDQAEPFSLMTSFPRKLFTDADMEKPLTELGLVPSAVLIVTKKT